MSDKIDRREFIRMISALGLSAAAFSGLTIEELARFLGVGPAFAGAVSQVYMAKGGTMEDRLKRVLAPLGSISRFVKKGMRVVLKPNIAWARKPEQAATTTPELMYCLVKACYGAGAGKVDIYEHTADQYIFAFRESGIQKAVENAGGRMNSGHRSSLYKKIPIPKGKDLTESHVLRPVLEADCFINVPTAKVHHAAGLTFGLKNHMGIIKDRGMWHRKDLQQCIADFSSAIRPALTIIDATRLLLTNGPKGPGKVKIMNTLIAGLDPVACDAVACTLFNTAPEKYPCLPMAAALGVGEYRLGKIRINTV